MVLRVNIDFSGKAEERRPRTPFVHQILQIVNNSYTDQDMVNVERKLLVFFNWDIFHPTTAHFLDYFAIFAVSTSDLQYHALGTPERNHLYKQMQHYLSYFLAATLKGK